MDTRAYWIEQFSNGAALGIMPRLRGHEWLANEIEKFKENGIGIIVSLLEKSEVQELGLQAEETLCRANKISFISLPIQDRGVPSSDFEALTLVNDLTNRVNNGEHIVITLPNGDWTIFHHRRLRIDPSGPTSKQYFRKDHPNQNNKSTWYGGANSVAKTNHIIHKRIVMLFNPQTS